MVTKSGGPRSSGSSARSSIACVPVTPDRDSGLSRRAVLLGSAGIVVGGAAVFGYEQRGRVRRLGHSVGVIGGADKAMPKVEATVAYHHFDSRFMGASVAYGLYQPPAARQLLVCLHGKDANMIERRCRRRRRLVLASPPRRYG